ncbi:hypothetical protein KUTeg_009831 [Tegillarca granosa]|uniref:Mitochondrial fission process protein 1 n=1 Tax=Tegillarca granosa TaxID=220873 RepID=A0ABQ9F505_TEGGR|nr:hypothetical protein KUTeg_009831 [Tegillarca granosa]
MFVLYLIGYANEVGEAFRSMINVNFVRLSYGIAIGYVISDAWYKGLQAAEKYAHEDSVKKKVTWSVCDTLIWQGLASVAIPGFTINRICFFTGVFLKKASKLPGSTRKWTTTIVGLSCIPLIIKPIDRSVDFFMENTFRKYFEPKLEKVVHHDRND